MRLASINKEKLIIVFLALFFILFTAGAYFYLIMPLQAELKIKQNSLKSEEKLLAVLQEKEGDNEKPAVVSIAKLQNRIPVKPLADQLILNFEKAEVVSDSKVISMIFANDEEAADPGQSLENGASTVSDGSGSESPTSPAAGQDGPQSVLKTPEGVEKITAQLLVESPGYEELEKFISTLESLKRIAVVESIDFTGGKEVTALDEADQPLRFTVKVSAFYMPGLTDLANQLPSIEAPAPANKRNPLSTFSIPAPEGEAGDNNEN